VLEWDRVLLWYSPSLTLCPQLRGMRGAVGYFRLPSGGTSGAQLCLSWFVAVPHECGGVSLSARASSEKERSGCLAGC